MAITSLGQQSCVRAWCLPLRLGKAEDAVIATSRQINLRKMVN
jgi:hypothetical protein